MMLKYFMSWVWYKIVPVRSPDFETYAPLRAFSKLKTFRFLGRACVWVHSFLWQFSG